MAGAVERHSVRKRRDVKSGAIPDMDKRKDYTKPEMGVPGQSLHLQLAHLRTPIIYIRHGCIKVMATTK